MVMKTFTYWGFAIFIAVGFTTLKMPVSAAAPDSPSASNTCEVVEFCARILNLFVIAVLAATMAYR